MDFISKKGSFCVNDGISIMSMSMVNRTEKMTNTYVQRDDVDEDGDNDDYDDNDHGGE